MALDLSVSNKSDHVSLDKPVEGGSSWARWVSRSGASMGMGAVLSRYAPGRLIEDLVNGYELSKPYLSYLADYLPSAPQLVIGSLSGITAFDGSRRILRAYSSFRPKDVEERTNAEMISIIMSDDKSNNRPLKIFLTPDWAIDLGEPDFKRASKDLLIGSVEFALGTAVMYEEINATARDGGVALIDQLNNGLTDLGGYVLNHLNEPLICGAGVTLGTVLVLGGAKHFYDQFMSDHPVWVNRNGQNEIHAYQYTAKLRDLLISSASIGTGLVLGAWSLGYL
ncbi:MAG: hypothetical protein CMO81_05460 [Waddliaceae bacterium]|nr:hypothetical protein [Waddliaceae bacterium]